MSRFALHLAYTGGGYQGWQRQAAGKTIQGELEKALFTILRQPVTVHASGRTDAGVHALDQVVHFDLPPGKREINWTRALNSLLPPDICVTGYRAVSYDFHAQKSARSKEYSYRFWTEPEYVLPHRRPFVWDTGPLDALAMSRACERIKGRHDFASFMNSGTPVNSTVREVYRAEIEIRSGPEMVFLIRASGFLKQMVRNMAGLLFSVGKGHTAPEHIPELISRRDRRAAPQTAPAKGLCLEKVFYPPAPDRE